MTQREREVWVDGFNDAWHAIWRRWKPHKRPPYPYDHASAVVRTAYALASRHGRRRVA